MTVELISVGTELLLGNIMNTNANYLAKKCAELGLSSYFQITVGDNYDRLSEVLHSAFSRSEIVIITGGLGPTKDDITKEVVANVLNRKLTPNEHTRERIVSYFSRANGELPESNFRQALTIEDAIVIDNDNGTAPGLIVEDKDTIAILLPGPPNEMIPMFERVIEPYLRKLQDQVFFSKMVKICGIGESKAEEMIMDLIDHQKNPTIAPYAKTAEVHFRVTSSGKTEEEAQARMEPILQELRGRFGNAIYTLEESESLEEVVVRLLKQHQLTLTAAESCTGGLFAGRIINMPGVSSIIKESFVTYANEAKIKNLGVPEQIINTYGAVSEETARAMAFGAAQIANAPAAISITGIAGPGGGTAKKPVGLVYIGCCINKNVWIEKFQFRGNRQKVRESAVTNALDLLRRSMIELYDSDQLLS